MTLNQKLTLAEYHLYLKESIYNHSLYRILYWIGVAMMGLVLYRYIMDDFSYASSMNGLIGIALLVMNFRYLSYFNEKRRLNKASYIDQLIAAHSITFSGDRIEVVKGDDSYELRASDVERVIEYNDFYVLELSSVSQLPIAKSQLQGDDRAFLMDWIQTHIEGR